MANKLQARFCERVTKPGRYGDGRGGHGLSLLVQESKSGAVRKSWTQRLRINGKPCDLGLGPTWALTLAQARAAALANHRAAWRGEDPRRKVRVPTFAQALERVIEIQRGAWREGSKTESQWRTSLADHAKPLMEMRVDAISTADVLAVLSPKWNTKRETMKRIRQRIQAVMKWAVAQNHRTDDPVLATEAALPKNGIKTRHLTALPYADVPAAIAAVRASDAYVAERLALEFLVLTAARSGEVRGATWAEIDIEAATWTIPADRMKAGREHRVPLSGRALELLAEARELADASGLVFPSQRGGEMRDTRLSRLLKGVGVAATVHGFRSSFRDWAAEQTDAAHSVMEAALAHSVRNAVEAAYARSDLFDKRRELMAEWAVHIDAT